MDEVFKALADSNRRLLLDRLFADNGQTLSQLVEGMGMSRQAVMKHLGVLEAANLVSTVRVGREKLHYLNPVPIAEVYDRWIGKYERHRVQAVADLKRGLSRRE
jgi:DNA-binding transcriptional ArsR family regulator